MKTKLNKTLLLASAMVVSMASTSGYADDMIKKTETKTERDADGNYVSKTKVESKDATGAKSTDQSEVKIKMDNDGDYKQTVKSKSTNDPKGLGNKSVIKSSQTYKNTDNKYENKRSVVKKDGVTGTKTSTDAKVEIKVDNDGNVAKTLETKTATDPKGLLNKSVTKTTEKLEQEDNDSKYHYTKKVNGKTVEDRVEESK